MKKNMGNIDRSARIILAIIFITLYFANEVTGVGGIILLILGIIFLVTSVVAICPLYSIFGISTCPNKEHKAA